MRNKKRVNFFQCSRYSCASRLKPFFIVSPYFSIEHILHHLIDLQVVKLITIVITTFAGSWLPLQVNFSSIQAEFFLKWICRSNVSSVSAAKVILLFDNWGNLPLLLLTVDFLRIFSTERLLAFARLEGGRFCWAADYYYCYHLLSLLFSFFIIIFGRLEEEILLDSRTNFNQDHRLNILLFLL